MVPKFAAWLSPSAPTMPRTVCREPVAAFDKASETVPLMDKDRAEDRPMPSDNAETEPSFTMRLLPSLESRPVAADVTWDSASEYDSGTWMTAMASDSSKSR